MIVSASRRTDIPAYYSDWFFKRLREGFALVRNPMDYDMVYRVPLDPAVTDGIVFWSKDPSPMLERLSELKNFAYYFQFTLNAYGGAEERFLPPLQARLDTFKRLADEIGAKRVIWRYDPIFINEKYTHEFHAEAFGNIVRTLSGYTERCVISFLDMYRGIERAAAELSISPPEKADMERAAAWVSSITSEFGMSAETCSEAVDLLRFGVTHGKCVDAELLGEIGGCPLSVERDRNQRPGCGCAASTDIGAYNTCSAGCIYCYASYSEGLMKRNISAHDVNSPLITGELSEEDEVIERAAKSNRNCQLNLFDML